MTSLRDVIRQVRSTTDGALQPFGLTRRSSGTGSLIPTQLTDSSVGYWDDPSGSGAKPSRWILQIDVAGVPKIRLAQDSGGTQYSSAGTPVYVNSRDGKVAVAGFRIMPALFDNSAPYEFPEDWEWFAQFVFASPLGIGTSGETLADFDVAHSRVTYQGATREVSMVQFFPVPALTSASTDVSGTSVSYEAITESLFEWFATGVAVVHRYNVDEPDEMAQVSVDIQSAVSGASPGSSAVPFVSDAPTLTGIPSETYALINASLKAGKRSFIFHGPPGTGKTTLAEHVASSIADPDGGETSDSYVMLTATSAWSSQDLVGGYQPIGGGNIAFVPGAMLRNFDRPIIIDELNRSPIDKVLGPMFSVLSGQSTTLPYRLDPGDAQSSYVTIIAKPVASKYEHEFAPGPNWALICTLNEIDKAQLEQLSFALARRFTWVRVGAPQSPSNWIAEYIGKVDAGSTVAVGSNPIGSLWEIINRVRELGAAPFKDLVDLLLGMNDSIDLSTTSGQVETYFVALDATVFPLLDGIGLIDARTCAEELVSSWGLGTADADWVRRRFSEISI